MTLPQSMYAFMGSGRSEEHTSELQSQSNLVCRLLLEKKQRHSHVTHNTDDGVNRRFIQVQVWHECDSSTAIYTYVSDDFMNTMLRNALAHALDPSSLA